MKRKVSGFAAVLALLLAGCVTETTGVPEPASREARVQAQINLARGYLESDNPARARAPLERAIEIDPGSADALGLFAVFYQGQGEPKLAEDYYRRALRAEPRHARNLNNYAVLLVGQGRYRDALGPLETLVQDTAYRGRANAFESLGLARIQVGQPDKARAAFERALDINPELVTSHLELAALALADGDHASATRHYEIYRAKARQTARSLCVGIQLAAATGDADQRASYELALRNLYPESPEAAECIRGR
jgi:type IV pilus assembly protein PilF